MEILKFAPPGMKARDWQIEPLVELERTWEANDVFVLPASVGFGKSFVAMNVSNWVASTQGSTVGLLTPRVTLQQQYGKSFPHVPVLMGKSRYKCKDMKKLSCGDMYESGGYCGGCKYSALRKRVQKANQAVFNFSSYLYSGTERDVLIIDEAHLLHEFLQDEYSMRLWKHKENYPDEMKTAGDVAVWLEGVLPDTKKAVSDLKEEIKLKTENKAPKEELELLIKDFKEADRTLGKYIRILKGIKASPTNFFLEHKMEPYGQKKTLRSVLVVRPETLSGLPPILWSNTTKKIILLSGTISPVDLRRLAIGQGRRIKWLDTHNPIPPENRPVSTIGAINMSYKYQDKNIPVLADRIKVLMEKHASNGVVHVPYAMAEKLKPFLTNDRFMWHTKEDKEEVLKEFLKSDGKILVASGMGEGIDLAGEKFGWQVIGKVMYPSKADKLIAKWYDKDSEWINWMTVRNTIQQTGRISRGPDDYGITYILDSTFGNIAKKRRGLVMWAKDLFPQEYLDSIIWREDEL